MLKNKQSELRLYCDLLTQQTYEIKSLMLSSFLKTTNPKIQSRSSNNVILNLHELETTLAKKHSASNLRSQDASTTGQLLFPRESSSPKNQADLSPETTLENMSDTSYHSDATAVTALTSQSENSATLGSNKIDMDTIEVS